MDSDSFRSISIMGASSSRFIVDAPISRLSVASFLHSLDTSFARPFRPFISSASSFPTPHRAHPPAHSTPPSIAIDIAIDSENENGDIHDGTRRRLRRSFRSTQNNYSSLHAYFRTVIPAASPMTPMAIITSAMRRSSSMERPKQLAADCVAALHPLVMEAATMKGSW